MLDLKLIRQEPERVRDALERRRAGAAVDELLQLDARRRELLPELEGLRAKHRFIYEEFLVLQIALAARRREMRDKQRAPKLPVDSEIVTGAEAIVKGRALSKSGDATPVVFSLYQSREGLWRVYDVSFEGMSLVGNYRAHCENVAANEYEGFAVNAT